MLRVEVAALNSPVRGFATGGLTDRSSMPAFSIRSCFRNMITSSKRLVVACSIACLPGVLMGQCAFTVVPGGSMPDADNGVGASCQWDPDGSGPQPPVVVLGGRFRQLGNATARGIAAYDPATRDVSALAGSLIAGEVTALMVTSSNDIIAGGNFTAVGGVSANRIARWDGVSWHAIGGGLSYAVESLTQLPNGDLVAGGFAAGNPSVMRWDGVSWSAIGTVLTGRVLALTVMPNGDLIAGGSMMMPGNVAIACWDGTSWTTFAGGITLPGSFGASVRVLKVLPNGDLLVAGLIQNAGGVPANGMARWDGVTWSPYGSGTLAAIYAVEVAPNGNLLVGGAFDTIGGISANQVARWDGAAWQAVGNGLGLPTPPFGFANPVSTLQRLPNGDLIAGGGFASAGGNMDHIARWDGTQWGPFRPGMGGAVLASAELANGDFVLGGEFTSVEGVAANYVVRRVNGVWQPLGSGANAAVEAVLEMPNGDLLVGGRFSMIGGVTANHIACWDGAAWRAIGGGLPGVVHGLAIDAAGQILAAGSFLDQVAVWDGMSWSGTGLMPGSVGPSHPCLLTLHDGEILASAVAVSSGGIYRWTGFGWQSQVATSSAPGPLAVGRDGHMAMARAGLGGFVDYWDGVSWTWTWSFFNAPVDALLILPNGDVLAAGGFTTNLGAQMNGLARWDGVAWSEVGTGTAGPVVGVRWKDDGGIAIAGGFISINGVNSVSFGELTTMCLATAVSQGTGCVGSGGLNVLTATSLPWLESEYESVASGMPTNSIAVQVLGLGVTSQAIASILPQGVAGCVLLTTPDLLGLGVPVAGEFAMSMSIPATASLVGATFRQQVVPLEVDAGGAILAVTASNALELTIGQF